MPTPRNYVPEIPISVEQIVFKCTQKSPDRRYQKMAYVIEDLKKSLISPDEGFVKLETMEHSAITRNISSREMSEIKQRSNATEVDKGLAVIAGIGAARVASDSISKKNTQELLETGPVPSATIEGPRVKNQSAKASVTTVQSPATKKNVTKRNGDPLKDNTGKVIKNTPDKNKTKQPVKKKV